MASYPGITTVVTIIHDRETSQDVQNALLPGGSYSRTFSPREAATLLIDFIGQMASGSRMGSIDIQIAGHDSAAATGTFTFSGAATANDTVLIDGVTFTAVASGATGNQWNVGASATATAANLAAAIAASSTALVSGVVTATAASGVCTVTALNAGTAGNEITIAKGTDAGSVNTVSGARLTGGTAATANTYKFGV